MIHINKIVTNPLMSQYDTIESVNGEKYFEIFFSFNKNKFFEKKYFKSNRISEISYKGVSLLGFNILLVKTRKLKSAMG